MLNGTKKCWTEKRWKCYRNDQISKTQYFTDYLWHKLLLFTKGIVCTYSFGLLWHPFSIEFLVHVCAHVYQTIMYMSCITHVVLFHKAYHICEKRHKLSQRKLLTFRFSYVNIPSYSGSLNVCQTYFSIFVTFF